MSKDLLTQSIVRLYEEERFYAEIVLQMDKVINPKLGAAAGVCIRDNIELHVDPEIFGKCTVKEQVAILKHECQHILNDHIPRSKELCPEVYGKKSEDIAEDIINSFKHKVLNIAADCSINPGITNLPDWVVQPSQLNLPNDNTFEWYVHNIKDNKKLKEMNEFDSHSIWGESKDSKEILKEKIRKAINDAAGRTRAAGRMSGSDELLVSKLNYKPRNWKSDLRRFVARQIETTTETSRKKRNRRYGITFPGTVKVENLHIGVAIDTSGSVSDEALCQFMAEIGNIAKYATVTVVEADSEVKASYLYDPKKTYKIKGRGGTAYQPALDYFTNETEVDGLIYFGDMDSSDQPKKPKYPVLWAVIGDQNPPGDFGSRTKVEIRRKNET